VFTAIVVLCWVVGALFLVVVGRRWAFRQRIYERVFDRGVRGETASPLAAVEDLGWLARWLLRAGYRAPGAATLFVGLQALAVCLGLLGVLVLFQIGAVERLERFCQVIPGAVGELLGVLAGAMPWLILAVVCLLPVLSVHDARKRRVEQVEQDLPMFLELLSTLSEAGLGFDAALARILAAEPATRPLALEFRTFQAEVLAGRPRVQCLRRLSRRVDVTSLTIFVSALVQAEQVGSGVADVLRRQSDDLRDRRREQAISLASTLPVKLLFPLVICFLPGLAVFTLGPIFSQLFKSVDPIIRKPTRPTVPSQPGR
jgi:pilus assembly protein TadC